LANNYDSVDPLLASAGLASNGGPTQTIALQATSPAFDAMPTVSRPMRLLAPPYPTYLNSQRWTYDVNSRSEGRILLANIMRQFCSASEAPSATPKDR
jgi:hypothetical protein